MPVDQRPRVDSRMRGKGYVWNSTNISVSKETVKVIQVAQADLQKGLCIINKLSYFSQMGNRHFQLQVFQRGHQSEVEEADSSWALAVLKNTSLGVSQTLSEKILSLFWGVDLRLHEFMCATYTEMPSEERRE